MVSNVAGQIPQTPCNAEKTNQKPTEPKHKMRALRDVFLCQLLSCMYVSLQLSVLWSTIIKLFNKVNKIVFVVKMFLHFF